MDSHQVFSIIGCINVAIATTNVAIAIYNIKCSRFLDSLSDSLVDLSKATNACLIPEKESSDSLCISGAGFIPEKSGD